MRYTCSVLATVGLLFVGGALAAASEPSDSIAPALYRPDAAIQTSVTPVQYYIYGPGVRTYGYAPYYTYRPRYYYSTPQYYNYGGYYYDPYSSGYYYYPNGPTIEYRVPRRAYYWGY